MTFEGSSVQSPLYDPTMPLKVIDYETISKQGVEAVVDSTHPRKSLLLLKTSDRGSTSWRGSLLERTPSGLPGPQAVDLGRSPEELSDRLEINKGLFSQREGKGRPGPSPPFFCG